MYSTLYFCFEYVLILSTRDEIGDILFLFFLFFLYFAVNLVQLQ